MPGVVLPEGKTFAFKEIPGGIVADGVIGFAESPAGIFAGSSFISLLVIEFALELELEAVVEGPLEPQPKLVITMTKLSKINAFLNMLVLSCDLK
jgi:hypothetical protein